MSSANADLEGIFGRSEVETELLRLIERHGLITKSVWRNTMPLSERSPVEVSTAMRSLTSGKLVVARQLHHGLSYFAFSKRSVAMLGLPERLGNPLSEQNKLKKYARMLFFAMRRPNFERLDKQKLSERLAQPIDGLPSGFYGNRSDDKFLGFLRVDSYIHSSPDRSSQVLRNDILRIVSITSIVDRIKRKHYEISWITATQRRADSVMQRFRTYDQVGAAPISVIVLPELIPLVTSIEI